MTQNQDRTEGNKKDPIFQEFGGVRKKKKKEDQKERGAAR